MLYAARRLKQQQPVKTTQTLSQSYSDQITAEYRARFEPDARSFRQHIWLQRALSQTPLTFNTKIDQMLVTIISSEQECPNLTHFLLQNHVPALCFYDSLLNGISCNLDSLNPMWRISQTNCEDNASNKRIL